MHKSQHISQLPLSRFENAPVAIGIGTALPPYCFTQDDVKEFAREVYRERLKEDVEKVMSVFDNSEVKTRYFSAPMSWFHQAHRFEDKNALYIDSALSLSKEAIGAALKDANVVLESVDAIVFTSTTGLSTPSIDARLIHLLPFKKTVRRYPLFGLGCSGGAASLSLARTLAIADEDATILVIAAECCGLTFQRNDFSKAALISTALFGDGAAAVVIKGAKAYRKWKEDHPSHPAVSLCDAETTILEDSLSVMGWSFKETGLHVILSKDVPTIVKKFMSESISKFLLNRDLNHSDLHYFVTHPGGAKVLEAYQESLGLSKEQLRFAYQILRSVGNLSAPTVLFILKEFLKHDAHPDGTLGLLGALGPGFSSELILLGWHN